MDKQKFDKLVTELQTGNVQKRRSAAYKLGKSKNPNVVPVLIHAYNDSDSSVRQNVVDGLRLLGTPEAIEFLSSKEIAITPPSNIKSSSGSLGQFLLGFIGWFVLSFIVNILISFNLFENLSVIHLFSSTHVDKIGVIIDNPQAVQLGNKVTVLTIQLLGYGLAYLIFRKNKRLASFGIILASIPYIIGIILSSTCMPPGLPFPLSLMSGC